MLDKVSEKNMHIVRWLLAIGWLVLIGLMFYDPITPALTHHENLANPFRIRLDSCIRIRETCLPNQQYTMTVIMWWAMIVPAGIFILLVFGHEFWRRICPLSFISQIPRALGIQRQRKVYDPITQEYRYEVATVGEDSWLGRNHLYLQSGLFFLGLGLRILFVNGDRYYLASFLLFTMACSILVGFLYGGKSWCNYFCPMSPVQTVYTGPRSLLGSQAHKKSKPGITQSMCRTVDAKTGQEQSACVSCKAPCIDIDAEKTYWQELHKPGRRLVQYGYLGMVIAFYWYYYLYSGNWDYYFTGAWTREEGLVSRLFDPGFYINGQSIPIPKAIAVFITYAVFAGATYLFGLIVERLCRKYMRWGNRPISAEQAQHVVFTLFSAVSFWTFFSYGARPSLNRLPTYPLLAFNALIVLVGAIWLYRTLGRTRSQYERECMANSLRKQLKKMRFDQGFLQGRSIEDLSADEMYMLVNGITASSGQFRLQAYTGALQDLLEQKACDAETSFGFCSNLRQELQLNDDDHFAALQKIAEQQPELLISSVRTSSPSDPTTVRPIVRQRQSSTTAPLRSKKH
ncbi:hypothetical protein IQ250_01525 [Pseudanabaenaceae cyanobacterium LEGE 13415]|nr:hypothetical protein [Pseudanabaenaceae cyanobacterium LEGE 13415]